MKLLTLAHFVRRGAFVCSGVLGLAALSACGGSDGDSAPPRAQPAPVLIVTANDVQSAAPTVAIQPAPQTVAVGQVAVFKVIAAGAAPLSYQWLRNGLPIAGATADSYTTAAATLADSADVLRVTITNANGAVTSDAALLQVAGVGVRTLAGNNVPSTLSRVDGVGKEARLQAPGSMTFDSAGNLLVVEAERQTIRQVTPGGVVTTWLPTIKAGSALRFPDRIAAGANGAVYVTDGEAQDNATALRKYSADGSVSTIALAGDPADPRAGDGSLLPTRYTALAADASGNLYVASEVTRAGPASCSSCLTRALVRKLAPDGKVTVLLASERAPAPMGVVYALAVDKGGNVYALDAGQLFKINAAGAASVALPNGESYLSALAVDGAGKLFFSAQEFSGRYSNWPDGAIGTLTADGKMQVVADPRKDARFEMQSMDSTNAIAVDASGAIYLSRYRTIRKLVLP